MSSNESDDPGKRPAGDAAEFAAASLLELTIRHGGARYFQGVRRPEIPCRASGEATRRFAKERFHRVPALAAEALVAWADGVPVELLRYVPDASHVLALQARGTRCVSVLAEPGPETGVKPLEFLLHDLCHLGKFLSASHYAEQVGFFSTLQSALSHPAWISAAAQLDEHFSRDLDHVSSDMNGSSVYLFAVLKMKIKMAARRQLARERGVAPPIGGPLSSDEQAAFGALLNVLLEAFHFDDTLRSAAFATSARRDAPEMATRLAQHFSSVGRTVLGPL